VVIVYFIFLKEKHEGWEGGAGVSGLGMQYQRLSHEGAVSRLADTTREQTLERCPNLALASVFFAPGTK